MDASVVLSILLQDQLFDEASNLWRGWLEQGIELVSAPLFYAEVTSVLRDRIYFDRLRPEDGEEAFRTIQ